ncbi:MAG: bifunctional hydroxymethylpyrimidine kinase/phosphomethylpyrimidine kinase, partial [Puniceicoccales bacterium]
TPNSDELRVLAGEKAVGGRIEIGQNLAKRVGQSVLLKGGHELGESCQDWLLSAEGQKSVYSAPRLRSKNLRGTGCVLSSAIACYLGQGNPLPEAVQKGKSLLSESLEKGSTLDWGQSGPSLV